MIPSALHLPVLTSSHVYCGNICSTLKFYLRETSKDCVSRKTPRSILLPRLPHLSAFIGWVHWELRVGPASPSPTYSKEAAGHCLKSTAPRWAAETNFPAVPVLSFPAPSTRRGAAELALKGQCCQAFSSPNEHRPNHTKPKVSGSVLKNGWQLSVPAHSADLRQVGSRMAQNVAWPDSPFVKEQITFETRGKGGHRVPSLSWSLNLMNRRPGRARQGTDARTHRRFFFPFPLQRRKGSKVHLVTTH